MRTGVVLAGVGGQGVLTLSRVLGEALLDKGYDVRIGEVHGLSQRGGSVVVFLRYGDRVYAPTVAPGEGDVMVALELIEAARRIRYLRRGGLAVANRLVLPPPMSGEPPSIEDLVESMRRAGVRTVVVDGMKVAERAGSSLSLNMAMLGALVATREIDLELSEAENAVRRIFKGRILEVNLAALRGGYKALKELSEECEG